MGRRRPGRRDREAERGLTAAHLSRSDRLQPLLLIGAIGLGLGLASVAPSLASSLLPAVSVGVGVLIYLIMLGLDPGHLRLGSSERRFVVTAVAINFVVAPALAWGLGAALLSGHPELRIGLLLFLVTPCIGWYLVFIDLANGDTALGVSLLAVNLVLQVILLPVYIRLLAGTSAGADLRTVVGSVATYLVAPTALAGATRLTLRRIRTPSIRVPPIATVKTITLFIVIASMFASQADRLTEDPATLLRVVVPILAFFVIMFVVALATARLRRMPHDQAVVLVFTTTSRNSEASLAIAVTAFASPLVAAVVAIGPALELPLLVLMVRALTALDHRSLGVR